MQYWRYGFLFTLLIFIGLSAFGWHYVHQPGVLPIQKVSVVGQRVLVREERIQRAILPYISQGFFNVDVEAGQNALATIPGIKSATIRKTWPNGVSIRVIEDQAMARWQNDAWLSVDGKIFHTDTPPPQSDQNLSQFVAFEQDIPLLLQMYPTLTKLLKTIDLHIQMITRLGYNAWRITTDKEFDIKLKVDDFAPLKSFLNIYPQLIEDNSDKALNSVDLRYPIGFSVKWQSA